MYAIRSYYVEYPVRHYTEFLAEHIEEIKPLLKENGGKKVAYHDPCYPWAEHCSGES